MRSSSSTPPATGRRRGWLGAITQRGGEETSLESTQHDGVEGVGRSFRTKRGRASKRGPRGMATLNGL